MIKIDVEGALTAPKIAGGGNFRSGDLPPVGIVSETKDGATMLTLTKHLGKIVRHPPDTIAVYDTDGKTVIITQGPGAQGNSALYGSKAEHVLSLGALIREAAERQGIPIHDH